MTPVINIVCDGNSLTNGFGSTAVTFGSSVTQGSYPSQLQALLTSTFATVTNKGINGQTTVQMAAKAATDIDPLYNSAYTLNLLIAFEIGNDMLLSPYVPAAQAYTNFVNYCLARKAAGWRVAIMTIPSRNGSATAPGTTGSAFDTVTRLYMNNLLRQNWASFSDFLIDIAGDVRMSSNTNLTYFTNDTIHFVDAGYAVLASYAAAAASALLYGAKQLTLKQLVAQLYTPTTMTTTAISLNNLSGTSFTVDVTSLGLSSNLTVVDYQVLNGSTDITASFTKTSQTQLTYAGTNITSGTKLTFYRKTPINNSEVTFISTTTASQLTNALSKLLLRVQELEARQLQMQSQLSQGGITLAPSPVIDTAYGVSWNGDISNAPSRNATYAVLSVILNAISGYAPLVSPAFTGIPTAPTASTSDNSTQIATTALVTAKVSALSATVASTYAPIASPTFTGNPAAPTQATTDSSTLLATTAWVKKWTNASAGMRIGGLSIAGNNQVVTTDSGGKVTISVSAFNFTGYFMAVVGNGDSSVAKNYVFSVDNTNTSTTQLVFYIWNATTNAAVASASVRVCWIYYGSYSLPS